MSAETGTPTSTGGFAGDVSWEIEKNSRSTTVRIRGNIQWSNWSANPDDLDDANDFMVGLGDGSGGSGKKQPLRLVIERLTAEARAGIAADLAALAES